MSNAGERLIRAAGEAAAEAAVLLSTDKLTLALASHINEHYGPRCTVFDKNCAGCQMWRALDVISRGLDEAESN